MEGTLPPRVISCVSKRKIKENRKLVLILVTYGGSADAAYRIGRYLQSVYDNITVFIPSYCKSAGTLLATAANSIVLSPFGELGPLDVQLRRKDEIFGRRSGLITRAAINDLQSHTFELFEHFMLGIISHSYGSVSFKVAADISARTSSEIMGKIYEQINPDSLGQDFRDLNVATKYCERLNIWSSNIKEDGIKRLVHDYPSHDFVIDIEEAKEIFNRVDLPSPVLYDFMLSHFTSIVEPNSGKDVVVKMIEPTENESVKHDAQGESNALDVENAPNGRNSEGADAAP